MSQMAYKRWNSKLEKYFQKKQQIVFGNCILEIPLEKNKCESSWVCKMREIWYVWHYNNIFLLFQFISISFSECAKIVFQRF